MTQIITISEEERNMDVRNKVAEILRKVKPTKDLEGINDIVEGGFLDSFELMLLISELTKEFNVEIGFEEIVPENFNSIDAMGAMVERLMK